MEKPKKFRAKRGTAKAMKEKIRLAKDYKKLGAFLQDPGILGNTKPILSPTTAEYEKILNERARARAQKPLTTEQRQKRAEYALARRLRNPDFAARHRQKMLGRDYRAMGRMLGGAFKLPQEKRKIQASKRKQAGRGMKVSLIHYDPDVMRMGVGASRASLVEYARRMKKRGQDAYIRRKIAKGLPGTIRVPMTHSQKKAKRRAAYRAKRDAKKQFETLVNAINNAAPPDPIPPMEMTPKNTQAMPSLTRSQMAFFNKPTVPATKRKTRSQTAQNQPISSRTRKARRTII